MVKINVVMFQFLFDLVFMCRKYIRCIRICIIVIVRIVFRIMVGEVVFVIIIQNGIIVRMIDRIKFVMQVFMLLWDVLL